ncbi:MAG: hypothetical protein IKR31_06940, partial [Prevotella sp.]|nr:hypothetical protein [Prevotella sp.]
MKRLLLSIIMVVIGLTAFSQSPSRLISLHPAYPLAIGESTVNGIKFTNNGLNMQDVYLDSLPRYEIGQIFEQTVRYSIDGHGFFVKADSLKSLNVTYSYEVQNPPQGTIEFNESTGRFKYYPAEDDYKMFTVTFTATNGTESVTEAVEFNLMPKTPSEEDAFNTQGTIPDGGDYTIIAEDSTSMYFNNHERTVYSISISGKDVIFDNAIQNKVWGLSGREDIYELNIYAERLIVRSVLCFPGTNITVYAKQLIFEDKSNVFASINTTPSSEKTLTDGEGVDGQDAGNITLYVKEFKTNPAIRLMASGATGQSSNRNGTPGKGGNGGVITSTVDISNYCDFVRGKGGVKYDVAEDGSTEVGPIIEYAEIGNSGRFVFIDKPYAYLHPYYLSAVIRNANDAFINNRTGTTFQICQEYRTAIDAYLNATEGADDLTGDETEAGLGLQNNLIEIQKMLFKIEQGLDYFGNPAGWVPLLSFEVMLENYNAEIDRAIPTLYMYYWLSRVDHTLQNLVKASKFAASTTEKEIDDNQKLLNSLVAEIPVLQDEATDVANQIEVLTKRIETVQRQLLAKAKDNVESRHRWDKLFGIAKAVVSVIPVIGKVGSAISGAVNTATSFTKTLSSLNAASSTASNSGFLSTITTQINNIKTAVNQNNTAITSAAKNIGDAIKPMNEKIDALKQALSNTTVSDSEVQAEYNKLLASSKTYKDLVNQAEELDKKKEELVNHMNQVFSDMTTTMSDISNTVLALDAFRNDAFAGNSKRDLNAMIYLEKMEQRAKERLLLYDYYLRKAYEYRLLKPYEGEFNLVGMFERFEALGGATGDMVDENAYSTLKSVFRERISDMTQEIVSGYASNYPEQSAPITIIIPKDKLNTINAEEGINLNFHEMGIFASDEENIRIVNLEIEHLETHVEGNVGVSGYMDLNMTHSGISTFRKDGHLYWFDHRSRNTTSPHTWGVRYDAVSKKTEIIKPSAASNSLLSTIINTGDVMMFSRPSAWSDVALTKKVHSTDNADVVIDSLVIKLQYDFTRRPDNIRNIDITASDGLLPYIACSTEDISGRSNGNGHLYRSYTKSSQNVTFTAVDKYESFWFKNWTDRVGTIVSTKPALTVNRQKDQFYTANYEYRGPLLSVPDTIYVGNEGGSYTVDVRNIGLSDDEMDWYVADTLSTFVHLNGPTEGIDDGAFTFTFEPNPTNKARVDFIEILAPESYVTLKNIYIIQRDEVIEATNIKKLDNAIYVNPVYTTSGSMVYLPVSLKNAKTATSYGFELVLPEGVSIETESDGNFDSQVTLSTRHKGHSVITNKLSDTTYKVAVASMGSKSLTDNEGVIVTIKAHVSDKMLLGEYPLVIQNPLLVSADGTKPAMQPTTSILSIDDYTKGDVDSDGVVDLADAVLVINHYVGKPVTVFNAKAADVDGDGVIDLADAVLIINYYVGKIP